MRRAAFGARPNEIQQRVSQGLEATVDELVNYDQVEEDASVPVAPTTAQGSSDITLLNIDDIATWWLTVMIRTKRPLRRAHGIVLARSLRHILREGEHAERTEASLLAESARAPVCNRENFAN